MNIAIIPARGGSKRIPRKNVRAFCGRPIIAWPIKTALASGHFEHVIVSTDDAEIAEVATAAGAEVPFTRPDDLADDYTGTIEVVSHAISWAMDAGWKVEAACCIYATAALVTAKDIASGYDLLSPECQFAFPAVRYGHPPQRGFLKAEDGSPALLQPAHRSTRTQDLPPVFHDSGQFYWGKTEAWLNQVPLLGPRSRFFEVPLWRAWDIDNETDWVIAEKLMGLSRERTIEN